MTQNRIHSTQSIDTASDPIDPRLLPAYRYCRTVTRESAKSFYFCAQFLPNHKRYAIYAVYAICRHIDDLVDAASEIGPSETRTILESWKNRLKAPGADDNPALIAWRDAAERFAIDARYAEELMTGVLMDLTTTRYATYSELELYCYRVASVVGLMTSQIFGYSDRQALDRAVKLGYAMQLTNICRDVGEDWRMGRIYIPLDEMARFGVTESDMESGRVDDAFVGLMQYQIDRARRLYAEAEPGIALLAPDCQLTVRLSSRIYAGILDRIEANRYDVLSRRAFVPLWRKLASIPAVWLETKRMDGRGHGSRRVNLECD